MANARYLTPNGLSAEPVKGSLDREPSLVAGDMSEGENGGGGGGGFDLTDSPGQSMPMVVVTGFPSSSSSSTIGTTQSVKPKRASLQAKYAPPSQLPRARLNSFDGLLLPSPTAPTSNVGLSSATSDALRRLHELTQEMQKSLDKCKARVSGRRSSVPVVTSPVIGIPLDGHPAPLRPGWETRRSPDGREANSWRSSGSDEREGVARGLPPPFPSSLRPVGIADRPGAVCGHISVPNLIAVDKPKMTPRVGLSSLGAKRQQQLRRRRQRNLTAAGMIGCGDVEPSAGADDVVFTPDTASVPRMGKRGGSAMRNSVSFCGIHVGDDPSTVSQVFIDKETATNDYPDTPHKSDSLVDVLHRRYYSHQYIANPRARPYFQIASLDQSNTFLQSSTLCPPYHERHEDRADCKGLHFPKSKSMNDASLYHGFSADVVEACRWLIEAGFPQYSQMFEDGSFPLDLDIIREDHRFMDDDAISALFRRINTLNEFVVTQGKESSDLADGELLINKMGRAAAFDTTDAGEEYALSRNWQFERDTRRWSRVDDPNALITDHAADDEVDLPSSNGHSHPEAPSTFSRSRSRASKRSGNSQASEEGSVPAGGSRSLLRSASLRLRTAVSRFRRGDLNFRSLRRTKKSSPTAVIDANSPECSRVAPSASTPLTISSPIPIVAMSSSPSAHRVLMSPASRVGPQTEVAQRRHFEESGAKPAPSDPGCMQILVNDTIDTGSGDKINIRTGSFMGKAGHRYEAFLRRRNDPAVAPPPPPAAAARKHESSPADVGSPANGDEEGTPAAELDRILQALYSDIDMLNEMMDSGRSPRLTNSSVSAPTSPRLLDVPSSGDSGPSSPADVLAQFTEIEAYDLDAQIVELKRLERLRRGDGPRGSLDRGASSSSRGHSSERENSLDSSTPFRSATSTLRRNAPSRWSSVERTCRQSVYQQDQSMGGMSVKQLILLRKIALLKLTTIMEKHCPPHKSLFSWAIPKLLRRARSHSDTDSNNKVFGVSLSTCLQRTGMFLPRAILNALTYLRNEGKTAHGIFRRAGGKARTLGLRDQIDKNPTLNDFSSWQAYDVADVVKLYFRELPECLLTNKLSSTLINIFIYLPLDLRLEALQWTVLRLPDENRMVLQCLLHFLRDMSEHSEITQMPASNLAMCLAPTLFNFPHALPSGLSPKRLRRVTGSPDPKDLADQKAAHECLTVMIQFSHQLFLISENILNQCQFDSDELGEPPPLNVLAPPRCDSMGRDWQSWAGERLSALLRDCREKGRGWVHLQSNQSGPVEIHHKKVNDGHPLKLWRCVIDVEAPPEDILHRLWSERSRWDPAVLSEEVVECLAEDAEITRRFLVSLAPPHPGRECVLLRARQCGLEGGACALLSSSITYEGAPTSHHSNHLPAFVMQEDILLDPCGTGKSRVHWLSRVDIRGFTAEWYGSSWGNFMSHLLILLQKSFVKSFVKSIESRETSL